MGADEAVQYKTDTDIAYRSGPGLTDYMKSRCKLDVYYPAGKKDFATVVWFHGGGLKNGNRFVPSALKEKGIAVVPVNYRLHPKVKSPAYVDDAAAAVAWTLKNISRYGGSAKRVFVSGHSAGGYLTSMVGLDRRWLKKHGADTDQLAGLIPYSGHTITHFTVRAERGIDGKQPVIDDMAPLFHVRKDCPPLLLVTGDRKLEMLGRYEENAYLWRMMQVIGHPDTTIMELDGYNHGQMAQPAHPLLLRFIERILKAE
jgi:acetyl esterase/lipase